MTGRKQTDDNVLLAELGITLSVESLLAVIGPLFSPAKKHVVLTVMQSEQLRTVLRVITLHYLGNS